MDAGLSIDDISDMTGFGKSRISIIENGGETNTSHLVEIAKAIGVPPSEIFNIPFVIKPRYKLSPKRQVRDMLTFRINKLYDETDFFLNWIFAKDVVQFLKVEYKIKVNSSAVSQILKRLVSDGKLKYRKIGRQNNYIKKA
jgi:transcriptional regulator with XRE-family HTH domain